MRALCRRDDLARSEHVRGYLRSAEKGQIRADSQAVRGTMTYHDLNLKRHQMKNIHRRRFELAQLLIFGLLMCGTALAQSETASTQSGIKILKLKWEKQVRLPRNFDPSTIPMNGVFNDSNVRSTVNSVINPADATRTATRNQTNAETSSVAV